MKSEVETQYKGYRRCDFILNGFTASVIFPDQPALGNPWIWRAEFLDDFNQADMALVKKGWYLVYYKISDLYGCPKAILLMASFHDYIVKKYALAIKTSLFGFSRGGLYAVNYATTYPEKVASLYLDAPVINLQSWPKGNGRRSGKNIQWEECLDCYGFDENKAMKYNRTQLNRATIIAKHKIPVLIIAGDSDQTVPFEENGKQFVKRYLEYNDDITVIIKKGCGHHPHSLEDVSPIITFVEKNRE